LENQESVYSVIGVDTRWDSKIISWLNHTRSKVRTGIRAPSSLKDIRRYLDEMRLIKDETELNIMRSAAKISSGAHIAAMKATAPNKNEYEVEAELLYHFKKHGSEFPAYSSIVAGGANSCVLHYIENNQKLKDGQLLLIDAGCELHGYASDITRTFPINGKYTQAQKEVYSIVLNAQQAAIGQVKAGNSWQAPHEAALKILAEGMVALGLLKGSVEEVIETEAFSRFYMHRTGHWLGMDVHDVGDYKTNGQWRNLEPGMVLTVEPGMYIRKAPDIPKDFWNIGIRIEDDVVVTGGSSEILTTDTPKSITDIEAIMAN
jgi:Xaa-Pro aminopeptidase